VTQIEKKELLTVLKEAVDGMDLMAVIDAADTAVQKSEKYWKTLFIGLQYLSF
jgi:TPP-dependent pyruvate/acetoin dehydrogenase alpha subunit